LIETGAEDTPGINGGLMKRQQPEQGVVNIIDVSSVDDFIQKVTDAGGTICVPKMAIPTIGYLAYFQDTDGNMFGMMEHDESVVAV
jgi:predicted enzyme related to lactoylglutathione lyase